MKLTTPPAVRRAHFTGPIRPSLARSADDDGHRCDCCGVDLGTFRQGALNLARCDACLNLLIARSAPRSHPAFHRDPADVDPFELE